MEREEVLFSHFRPDERIFVERVIDWVNRVANRYQPILTPFLNPREQAIVGMWVRRSPDLNVSSDGGVTGAERRRVRIYPPYMEDPDHGLAFLEVKSTNRSATLLHPDILGSLLGLGVKREVLGDIFVTDTGCQLIATQEIAGYIELQLNRVGRTPVRVKEIHRDDLCSPKQMTETVRVSVASLRLDAVVAEAFRLSRTKVATLIKNGKCHLNWKKEEKVSEPVREGDMISLRGYGRAQMAEILGETRKGRMMIRLIQYV